MRFCADIALIERVQHCVPGTISCSTRTLHGLLTKVCGVTAKGTLVNRAIRVTVERHAEVLHLVHDLRRLAAHELNRILIAEIVGTLDGVEHMPVPAILGHITERSTDTTLSSNRVRACREYLRQHSHR